MFTLKKIHEMIFYRNLYFQTRRPRLIVIMYIVQIHLDKQTNTICIRIYKINIMHIDNTNIINYLTLIISDTILTPLF